MSKCVWPLSFSQTRSSAIADCTARRVCNVKRTSCYWGRCFRPKFYGNGVIPCQNVDTVRQLIAPQRCHWKFLDNKTLITLWQTFNCFGRTFCKKRQIWISLLNSIFVEVKGDARSWFMARWKANGQLPIALIRPCDIHVVVSAKLGCFLSFFVSYPPRSLNGSQPKPATCSQVSMIWKRMSEIWDIPFPANRGPKNQLFRPLRNLAAISTAYNIFKMKRDMHNRATALTTTGTRSLLHRLKMSWTLAHKRLQTGPPFYPPYVNSAFYFIARLRRRSSANFAKRWTVNGAKQSTVEKSGSSFPKNWGPKNFYICSVFRRLRDLTANLLNESWGRQSGKGVGKYGVRDPLHCSKISWTFVYKWLKMGPASSRALR